MYIYIYGYIYPHLDGSGVASARERQVEGANTFNVHLPLNVLNGGTNLTRRELGFAGAPS